mgnify:CR=1 FL=1
MFLWNYLLNWLRKCHWPLDAAVKWRCNCTKRPNHCRHFINRSFSGKNHLISNSLCSWFDEHISRLLVLLVLPCLVHHWRQKVCHKLDECFSMICRFERDDYHGSVSVGLSKSSCKLSNEGAGSHGSCGEIEGSSVWGCERVNLAVCDLNMDLLWHN